MSVTFDQRKFLGGSTSTPAGVGPGLYDLAAAYDALAASSKNAASSSFLSKSSKNNPRWNYVVGPGAYEASSGFDHHHIMVHIRLEPWQMVRRGAVP